MIVTIVVIVMIVVWKMVEMNFIPGDQLGLILKNRFINKIPSNKWDTSLQKKKYLCNIKKVEINLYVKQYNWY